MDPFEQCFTEEEVDEKLDDFKENGRNITPEIAQQASSRKLQIQSQNGEYKLHIFNILYKH